MPYDERLEIRLSAEEKALAKKAAHRREMTLAQFLRIVIKEASEFYVKQP